MYIGLCVYIPYVCAHFKIKAPTTKKNVWHVLYTTNYKPAIKQSLYNNNNSNSSPPP